MEILDSSSPICLRMRLFKSYKEHDFARTGILVTEKVELNEGPLEQFTHEMEPFQARIASSVK